MGRASVRVSPGSNRAGLRGRHGAFWKITVAASPDRGRANEALRAFLAEALGVRPRDVSIVAGARRRDKVVEVAGLADDELARRLQALVDAT